MQGAAIKERENIQRNNKACQREKQKLALNKPPCQGQDSRREKDGHRKDSRIQIAALRLVFDHHNIKDNGCDLKRKRGKKREKYFSRKNILALAYISHKPADCQA